MKKLHERRFGHQLKRWVKRHLVAIIVIPVAILSAGGFLYWYNSTTETKVADIQKTTDANNTQMDAKIKDILAQKAAELAAKQEAAAKAAADQAQTANDGTASTINSSDCNTSKTHIDPSSIDVLVNKKHCIQPVTYEPGDLVNVDLGTNGQISSFLLSAKAAPSYNAMMAAARADGISMALTSSYRSYSDQVSTYAYWVNTSGTSGADTYSARPGYSEHQTGFAFDTSSNGCTLDCFGTTSAYTWMQANAPKYGFIQRYQAGEQSITGYETEEWHYRYVGVAVAQDMQAKGIKTLEEYWGISGGDYY